MSVVAQVGAGQGTQVDRPPQPSGVDGAFDPGVSDPNDVDLYWAERLVLRSGYRGQQTVVAIHLTHASPLRTAELWSSRARSRRRFATASARSSTLTLATCPSA